MRDQILFYLNGQRKEVGADRAGMMLADYLRYEEGLPGTKIVCAEGDCGACTVLRIFPWPEERKKPAFLPINSCITTVAQMDGSSLVTVDVLHGEAPNSPLQLTPVQQSMVSSHGSQCGYCTPGFVMALTGLVEKKLSEPKGNQKLQAQEIKNALTGNLCRCTGYQPIIDAAISIDLKKCASVKERFYSKTQEKELRKALAEPLGIEGPEFSFHAPASLKEASAQMKKHRNCKIASGGTDVGVFHNKRKARLTQVLSLHLVPELYQLKTIGTDRISAGARVTLTELRDFVRLKIPEFARFLDLFASPQIKNVATLAGNVANASPIGDTPPFLLVTDATITTIGPKGKRCLPIAKFYSDYRKTTLLPNEAIAAIEFDVPKKSESLALYKVSQRKDLDISAVNAAFRVEWADARKERITTFRLAMGGIAPTSLRLKETEAALTGAKLDPDLLARVALLLHAEMSPIGDLRGSSAFRRVIVENIFYRFFRDHAARGVLPS